MRRLIAAALLIFAIPAQASWWGEFWQAYAGNLHTRCSSPLAPSTYDLSIYRAAHTYWAPQRTAYWCTMKSQMWAESDFRPAVVSHVGAEGLAQFMPATWKEVADELGITLPATDPGAAIKAQAYYMEHLSSKWSSRRPEACRLRLAMASYNAGFGNILKAQRLALMTPCWDTIQNSLPEVTGRHSEETIGYVDRIDRQYEQLTGSVLQ